MICGGNEGGLSIEFFCYSFIPFMGIGIMVIELFQVLMELLHT